MPTFQAINLEPEENVDEQIDTTKELHVDEALKRFQHALRLHAQGPRSREAAGAAYEELFESEIFDYREAHTDYERAERQADGLPEVSALEAFSTGLDIDAGGADGVAASLAQALYLSHKNYGQYFLDNLKDERNAEPQWKKRERVSYTDDEGKKVLDHWVAALDQDPSDPELWRRVARLGASMGSGRLKRYCLESAVELDDDPTVAEVDPPSLAEGLAGEELKDYLNILGDEMALTHPVMAPWLKKEMPAFIKRQLDPIPFLPEPTKALAQPISPAVLGERLLEVDKSRYAVTTVEVDGEAKSISTWSELGVELLYRLDETFGAFEACAVVIQTMEKNSVHQTSQNETNAKDENATSQDENAGTQESRDSTTVEADSKAQAKDQDASGPAESKKAPEQPPKERTMSISTRKRSQSAAGLAEGDEENGGEKRSKRIRRRETTLTEEVTDLTALAAKQLQPYQEADQNLFQMTKNILESLGAEDKTTLDDINEVIESCTSEERPCKITTLAARDLREAITNFNEEVAGVLLNKNEQPTLSLSSFLEHAKSGAQDQSTTPAFDETSGLLNFAEQMKDRRPSMIGQDVVFEWVKEMSKSYTESKWPDSTKLAVVQMLNRADAITYTHVTDKIETSAGCPEKVADLESLVLMVFELHIDIYERITNPSSAVDYATRVETKYRLERWLDVASAFMRLCNKPWQDPACARFLWAATMASSHTDSPVREHILMMWTSLRDLLAEQKVNPIKLPNNVVMPTISPAAADREISKLTTMDFFLGLFQEEMESPVQVIETLEPVLNPSTVYVSTEEPESSQNETESSTEEPKMKQVPISENASQGLRDLWKFLAGSSTELKLFLWSRLGDAYSAIGYTTKRFSCYLKSIEMITDDLRSETYAKTPDESRRLLFMRTMKSLDERTIQALSLALNDRQSFDIIDDDHIESSCNALARVSSFLHVAFLCEDEVRVGITSSSSNSNTFQSLMNKLRDMQVRVWCLQYRLLKAGLEQQDVETLPEKTLADLLAATHQVIGLRKSCKASNKIFLKLMRAEILKFKNLEGWEDYLAQVLYDLYGLKLGFETWGVEDHGCPHEDLEKKQTLQLAEKVMTLASRMPMKDLLKSDLKNTIDHMQQTIGQTKSTPQMIHNLRNFTELLKRPIHPLRLYQALTGGVSVDAVSVNLPETPLAENGWFYLLGMIVLTKFKGVDLNRRQTPGAIDDLRIGATFLRLQLQFTADRWDAWFRLAECFDYELDEAVLWTADKMNKERGELVKFQRNAIHCYTLALSHSRHQEVETTNGDPLHDLYHEFGMRLYSSSREPFRMEPFQHSELERFFIESMGPGTFKRVIHEQMSEYKLWKFAAKLFKMAMERRPGNWKNPYMLAKCYWKMFNTPEDRLDSKDRKAKVTGTTVLDTLKKAIQVAYNARKSRSSEPILEPHYKIVSVLHKMVVRRDLSSSEAAAILSDQPFGIAVNPDDHFASFSEPEDWEEYIIRNLTKLKEKDKSNWHHRTIMRHAHILFDDSASQTGGETYVAAKAAFGVLRESMFTKTMVMNVWKCDAERPGRHHVYTEQYMRFMTKLLVIMGDHVNLELLLRRLRRKGADFYHFTELWQTCCTAYVNLLRKTYKIPDDMDEVFRTMSVEEFEIISERITEWAEGDVANVETFICMKDTIELKKLNATLMKASAIDDLIADSYSKLYRDISDSLPGPEPSKIIQERKEAKDATPQPETGAEGDGKPPSALDALLNPSDPKDSTTRATTPMEAEKSEPAPRARKPGIRRPDIVRKAEQAVVRSLETTKPTTKGRLGSISSGKRGSQTPNIAASDAGSDDEGPDAQVRREAGENMDVDMDDAEGGNDGEGKEHSDAGSLDESADESDLSDVPDDYDEEMPPGLRFPNLGRIEPRGETSGSEADSESEGDEAVDAEEVEEAEEQEQVEGEEEEAAEVDEEAGEEDEEEQGEEEEEDGDEQAEEEDEEETPDVATDGDVAMGEAETEAEEAISGHAAARGAFS